MDDALDGGITQQCHVGRLTSAALGDIGCGGGRCLISWTLHVTLYDTANMCIAVLYHHTTHDA